MTLWEFSHAVEGWKKVHVPDSGAAPLSEDEFADLADFIEQPPVWER
jgi:hypothetical protein